MKKINPYNWVFLISVLLMLFSCGTRTKYERPNNLVNEDLFRTDLLPKDSSSLADISWKQFFTDAILQKHIEKALDNNLDIRVALQNISITQAYLKQSKAAFLPSLSVGADYNFFTQSQNRNLGDILGDRFYTNLFEMPLSFSWDADLWGKLSAQKKSQMANYLGSIEAHKAVKSNLVSAVATSYFLLLTYDQQKNILEKTIELRNKNFEATKSLKSAGILTEVAVKQSEALVYNAKAQLVSLEVQIKLLENTISLLEAEPSQKIERSSINLQTTPTDIKLGYPVQLLSNRPDVKQAEYDLINTFELSNSAKAQFYPSFKITANAGIQSIDLDRLFSLNSVFANVIVGLAQPILNKRQIKTNYEVSLSNKEKAYLNFKKTILTAGKEVSNALEIYTAQDNFIALKEKELDAYSKSVSYSEELVTYGLANYLEVINASVNQLNAELNIANAKYTKLQASVDLYRALGGGWK